MKQEKHILRKNLQLWQQVVLLLHRVKYSESLSIQTVTVSSDSIPANFTHVYPVCLSASVLKMSLQNSSEIMLNVLIFFVLNLSKWNNLSAHDFVLLILYYTQQGVQFLSKFISPAVFVWIDEEVINQHFRKSKNKDLSSVPVQYMSFCDLICSNPNYILLLHFFLDLG